MLYCTMGYTQSRKHLPFLRRATTIVPSGTKQGLPAYFDSFVRLGSHRNTNLVIHTVVDSNCYLFVGCMTDLQILHTTVTSRITYSSSSSCSTIFLVNYSHFLDQTNCLCYGSDIRNDSNPIQSICDFYH